MVTGLVQECKVFFFSIQGDSDTDVILKNILISKELYTSETTLPKMIVLTPLNFEFIIKIQNLTSFMLKNPQKFLQKNKKGHF